MSFLLLFAALFPNPSSASTMDDLVKFNQTYCADYFTMLQFRKSSVATLKQIDTDLTTIGPKVTQAKSTYVKELATFTGLTTERQSIVPRVAALDAAVTSARDSDSKARAEAVTEGYFQANETIDSPSIAAKVAMRNADIAVVQGRIDVLEAQIQAIEGGAEFIALANERSTARQLVAQIESTLDGLRRTKNADQDDLDNVQITITSLMNRISTNDARRVQVEQQILPPLQSSMQSLTTQLQQLDAQISSNENDMAQARPQVEQLGNQYRQITQRREELERTLDGARRELSDLNGKLQRMQDVSRQADDISRSRLPQARNDFSSAVAEQNSANQAVSDSQQRLSQARSAYDDANGSLSRAQNQRSDAARQLDQARNELAQVNQALSRAPDLQRKQADLANRINQANADIARADSDIANARNAQSQAQDLLRAAEAEVADLQNKAREAQREVQELTQRIGQVTRRIDEVNGLLNDADKLNQKIADVEAQKTRAEGDLAQKQNEVAGAQTELSTAQAELDRLLHSGGAPSASVITDNQPCDIGGRNCNGGDHGPRGPGSPDGPRGPGGPGGPGGPRDPGTPGDSPEIQAARERVNQAQQRLQRAQREQEMAQRELDRITQMLATLKGSLTDKSALQAELSRLQSELPNATSRRDSRQRDLDQINGQIQNNAHLAAAHAAVSQADAAMSQAQGIRNQLATNLGALNQEKSETDAALNALAAQERRKSELEGSVIPPLDAQVRTLDQQIADLNGRVSNLASQVRDADQKNQQAVARKTQADQRSQAAQAQVSQLEQTLAQLNQQLQELPQLQARKQQLEGQIIPSADSELRQVVQNQGQVGQAFQQWRTRLDQLQAARQQFGQQRADLAGQYQAASDEFGARSNEDVSLQRSIASDRGDLQNSQTQRSQLEDELERANQNLAQKQIELPPAQDRQSKADSAYDKFYAANISPIDSKVSAEVGQRSGIESQVSDLRDLDSSLLGFAKKIADAQAQIATLTQHAADLDRQIAAQDPIVQAAKQASDTLVAQAKALADQKQGIMDTAAGQLAALKASETNQDKIVKELK